MWAAVTRRFEMIVALIEFYATADHEADGDGGGGNRWIRSKREREEKLGAKQKQSAVYYVLYICNMVYVRYNKFTESVVRLQIMVPVKMDFSYDVYMIFVLGF